MCLILLRLYHVQWIIIILAVGTIGFVLISHPVITASISENKLAIYKYSPKISATLESLFKKIEFNTGNWKQKNLSLKVKLNDKSGIKGVFTRLTERTYAVLKSEAFGDLWVEGILGLSEADFQERLKSPETKGPPKVIHFDSAEHSSSNLGGCPDWNCEFISGPEAGKKVDAILLNVNSISQKIALSASYTIHFSQESPAYSFNSLPEDVFNFSLSFRRDSPAASPYGYAVKLAPQSRRLTNFLNTSYIFWKSKAIAWFVSHCDTLSLREEVVNKLQEYINVDIYGRCGSLSCEKGEECEAMLDTTYFFYLSFENSICKDYITEKLWNQGYGRTIVPVVLRRKIVEPYVPPHSFIAVDDFKTFIELANYMTYLMSNRTAYMEYFDWRRDYAVIFLDGSKHDGLERPWGFCQICRLIWQQPLLNLRIENFRKWWSESCEYVDSNSFVEYLTQPAETQL